MYAPRTDLVEAREKWVASRTGRGNPCYDIFLLPEVRGHMNIYVGNVAFKANVDDLRQIFEEFGAVANVTMIIDRDTGRSRGFGFVEMPDTSQARSAIESLHGKPLLGRPLTVNEARPRESREFSDRPMR